MRARLAETPPTSVRSKNAERLLHAAELSGEARGEKRGRLGKTRLDFSGLISKADSLPPLTSARGAAPKSRADWAETPTFALCRYLREAAEKIKAENITETE
ncbi:MAG: hypothetical protein CFK52_07390 [Chloracidobacterium sp. CP2_5A]|nr:MAG: hypothetical protein CFK52_07390 [Chloracidobacterium sp. CP2_5A]